MIAPWKTFGFYQSWLGTTVSLVSNPSCPHWCWWLELLRWTPVLYDYQGEARIQHCNLASKHNGYLSPGQQHLKFLSSLPSWPNVSNPYGFSIQIGTGATSMARLLASSDNPSERELRGVEWHRPIADLFIWLAWIKAFNNNNNGIFWLLHLNLLVVQLSMGLRFPSETERKERKKIVIVQLLPMC